MEASSGVPGQPASGQRWPALRTVATIFRVLAWLIVGLGGLAVLIGTIAVAVSDDGGIGEALLTLVFGALGVGFYALITFATAELITIGIAIEENTHRTADALAGGTGSPSA
jgi:hypothetical protein